MTDQSKKAFEDSVRAILTTFGVFTGFAIKSAIDAVLVQPSPAPPPSPSWLAFLDLLKDFYIAVATIALLLRYIIGSAVHLNLCYVVEPRSKMPVMLFKDLAFLIIFGLIAVFMIKAGDDVAAFSKRAFVFVATGLVWSIVDWLLRLGQTESGEKTLFSAAWSAIDVLQLGLILFVLYGACIHDPWWQAFWLAFGFLLALYLDMKVVLGAKKPA
jgi:hypothetical protein